MGEQIHHSANIYERFLRARSAVGTGPGYQTPHTGAWGRTPPGSEDTEQRMEGMEESDRPAFPAKPVLHVQAVWFGVWHLPSLRPTVLTFKVVLNILTKVP